MNLLILDTETAKYKGIDTVYNIAWTIMTKSGKIKSQKSFLVADVYEKMFAILKKDGTQWNNQDYYMTKSVMYESQLDKVTFKRKWTDILETLTEDMKAYDIPLITAYNVGFDKRVIQTTTELLIKTQITNIKNTVQVLDKRFNIILSILKIV